MRPVLRLNDGFDHTTPHLRDYVKELQNLLNQMGYSLNPDGRFGSQTEIAMREFQEVQGLDPDGIVGPLTWAELLGVRPTLRLYDGYDQTTPYYYDEVMELQDRLKEKGFPIKADGHFGLRTLEAVKKFQKSQKLKPDGIVGSRTWSALLGTPPVEPAPQPTPSGPPETGKPPKPEQPPSDKPPVKPPLQPPATTPAAGIYYKDSPRLAGVPLAPKTPIVVPAAEPERTLIRIFNRLGGLMEELADESGIDVSAILAVWKVESGGREHVPQRAVIRFENHKLFSYWGQYQEDLYDRHFRHGGRRGVGGKAWENHSFREDPDKSFQPCHLNQGVEYQVLKLAATLAGEDVAYRCISIGGPQILGSNYRILGYSSPEAMYEAFQQDERAHVLGFFDFCQANKLVRFLRSQDWWNFAKGYNGAGQVEKYGSWIEAAFSAGEEILTG